MSATIPIQERPRCTLVTSTERLPELDSDSNWIVDIESSGVNVHIGHRLAGIALGAVHSNEAFYVPVRHPENVSAFKPHGGPEEIPTLADRTLHPPGRYQNLPQEHVFNWLRRAAADETRTWVMHNAVFDLGYFRAEGVEFAGRVMDTLSFSHAMIGDLLNYSLSYLSRVFVKDALPNSCEKLLKNYLDTTQRKVKTWEGPAQQNYSLVPIDLMTWYATEDIHKTRELLNALVNRKTFLPEDNFGNPSYAQKDLIFHEFKLVRTLFEMQWDGVKCDLGRLLRERERALDDIATHMAALRELCGFEFSVYSQAETALAFECAGGEVMFWTRTKEAKGKQKRDQYTRNRSVSTGRPCFNASAILEYLEHYQDYPDPRPYQFIIHYRAACQISRLVGTYLDAIVKYSDFNSMLHASFLPQGTRTGRLSSRDPNCQNFLKNEDNADTEALKKILTENDDMDLFITVADDDPYDLIPFYQSDGPLPDREGRRIDLAKKIRSFFVAEEGTHLVAIDYQSMEYRVAAYFTQDEELLRKYRENPDTDFHQFVADILGIKRAHAKTFSFGLLYGMGIGSMAAALTSRGLPTTFEEAKALRERLFLAMPAMRALLRRCEERARTNGCIINPLGRVCRVSPGFEYKAINYLIQGTCGDIMRRVMVRIFERIQRENWPIKMMLTIHDELVFQIPDAVIDKYVPLLVEMMMDVDVVTVPLTCDCEIGKDWRNLEDYASWSATRRERINAA